MMKKWQAIFRRTMVQSQWIIGEQSVFMRFTGPRRFEASLGPSYQPPSNECRRVVIIDDANMANGTLAPGPHCPWSMLPAKARLMASEALRCNPQDLAMDHTINRKTLQWWAVPHSMVPNRNDTRLLAIEPASQAMQRGLRHTFPDTKDPVIILQPHGPQRFHCTILDGTRSIHQIKQKPGDCLQWFKHHHGKHWLWLNPEVLLGTSKTSRPDWVPVEQWLQGPAIKTRYTGKMPTHWQRLPLESLLIVGGGALRRSTYGD